jgi:acyl dehydratase
VAANYDVIKSWPTAPVSQRYSARDTIIYNLGIGANVVESPADADLSLVWEERLRAFPTLVTVLGVEPYWYSDPRTGLAWERSVHGEHSIEWHAPLAPEGEVIGRSVVEELFDKGPGRGALLVLRRTLSDAASGQALATIRQTVFFRADGGFGGPTGAPMPSKTPDSAPDNVISLATRPEQALIYRLSGDHFPLHVDPAFAVAAGFPKPILHGLCTYAIAARAVVAGLCDGRSERLRRMDARFSSPVFPGETIDTQTWRLGRGEGAYRCRVGERVVIENGYVRLE